MPRRAGEGHPRTQERHRLTMPELTCFRLLDAESPAGPLAEAVRQVNAGQTGVKVFTLDASAFRQVPNAPFAYWVDDIIRNLFRSLPPFESGERCARQGLATADDFRYVRCWWEVSSDCTESSPRWVPFAKGGGVSPYYADIFVKVDWKNDGQLLGMVGNHTPSRHLYFKAGAFQTLRSLRLAPHLTPRGCVFGHNGFQFFASESWMLFLLGLTNSRFFESLYRLNVGKDEMPLFIAGVMQLVPVPEVSGSLKAEIEDLAKGCWLNRRRLAVRSERSPWFSRPAIKASTMADSQAAETALRTQLEIEFSQQQACIEKLVLKAYGNVAPVEGGHSARSRPAESVEEEAESDDSSNLARSLISFAVGLAFGRWQSNAITPEEALPEDPLTALPQSPPGLAPRGQSLFITDDVTAGSSFVEQARNRLVSEFGTDAEAVVCAQIETDDLGVYLSKSGGFFADHLAVYTKSRRQAPIYWPLSTKSGNFTLWVYYPKLDDQSLPKLIADVLSPKIRTLSQEIENRRATPGGKIGELEALRQELEEMRTDFLDLINRGYRPNQNDGVLITACPLAKYFRHAGFRKNLEACWKELARGDYDWSHLAMAMWPERVLEVCKKDRSIAIAHGKEDLCPAEPPKATRGRKKSPPST